MNNVILIGRLTRNPEVGGENTKHARFTLAVDRRFNREGEQSADFISCVAFGRSAEFAQNYLYKGKKIAVTGRIQTGSYTKQDGTKVYTTDVIVEDMEFVESKAVETAQGGQPQSQYTPAEDDFMSIPDGIDDELPFH